MLWKLNVSQPLKHLIFWCEEGMGGQHRSSCQIDVFDIPCKLRDGTFSDLATDTELGPLLDCLGSLWSQEKASFYPSLERNMCECIKLFSICISSWLFRQTAIDRILGMYCGKMGHTCTFLKAKSFISKAGMGFFLSVVIHWVQVRLCSVPLVSSEVTEGFQWHREAFQNKLVFVCLLGWHTEQGHICVAKLN